MRNLINLIESASRLDERYSEDNSSLRNYLRDAEFDPYAHWYEVCEWLDNNDYLDEFNAALNHMEPGEHQEISDTAEMQEIDPGVFSALPNHIQKECAKYVIERLLTHDPAEAPTWAHLTLSRPKLLKRTTWLVHFTDNPSDIARSGFTFGIDQMDKLGLTTWTKNTSEAKKYGGYNFAFKADSRYANNAASSHRYGRHAVLFQNSGVQAYHHGDEEDQVLFWGKDVHPGSIIVLTADHDEWSVRARSPTRRDDVLFKGGFEAAVTWVMAHQAQYRKAIYGR